jgi:hypothetical protein
MAEPPNTNPAVPDDWGQQATATFVELIDNVRSKSTGPALKMTRALVYGIVIIVATMALVVLGVAGTVRFLDAYLPGDVWSAHLLTGGIFLGVGLFLWSKRHV